MPVSSGSALRQKVNLARTYSEKTRANIKTKKKCFAFPVKQIANKNQISDG